PIMRSRQPIEWREVESFDNAHLLALEIFGQSNANRSLCGNDVSLRPQEATQGVFKRWQHTCADQSYAQIVPNNHVCRPVEIDTDFEIRGVFRNNAHAIGKAVSGYDLGDHLGNGEVRLAGDDLRGARTRGHHGEKSGPGTDIQYAGVRPDSPAKGRFVDLVANTIPNQRKIV